MQNGTSDGLLFHLTGFSSAESVCVCVCLRVYLVALMARSAPESYVYVLLT